MVISEAILTAGQATVDNLPPNWPKYYMMRVPTLEMAEQVTAVLDQNAQAAAMTTAQSRTSLRQNPDLDYQITRWRGWFGMP